MKQLFLGGYITPFTPCRRDWGPVSMDQTANCLQEITINIHFLPVGTAIYWDTTNSVGHVPYPPILIMYSVFAAAALQDAMAQCMAG